MENDPRPSSKSQPILKNIADEFEDKSAESSSKGISQPDSSTGFSFRPGGSWNITLQQREAELNTTPSSSQNISHSPSDTRATDDEQWMRKLLKSEHCDTSDRVRLKLLLVEDAPRSFDTLLPLV